MCYQSQTLKSVCEDLGVTLAVKILAVPSTYIEFSGNIINLVKQELQLPRDKPDRPLSTCSSGMHANHAGKES